MSWDSKWCGGKNVCDPLIFRLVTTGMQLAPSCLSPLNRILYISKTSVPYVVEIVPQIPRLDEVVDGRLPQEEAARVPVAITQDHQHPDIEGVRTHFLQHRTHEHLPLTLLSRTGQGGWVERAILGTLHRWPGIWGRDVFINGWSIYLIGE